MSSQAGSRNETSVHNRPVRIHLRQALADNGRALRLIASHEIQASIPRIDPEWLCPHRPEPAIETSVHHRPVRIHLRSATADMPRSIPGHGSRQKDFKRIS